MKIHFSHFKVRHREDGVVATMVFMALLAIMVIVVASNVRMLVHLHATEKLIEQKQIQRLNVSQTNNVAVVESQPKSK